MVTLAVLMRARSQFLLAELVGEIRSAAVDVDITLDLDSGADRRTMHAVLLVLIEYGVLTERDGDIEHWAENNAPIPARRIDGTFGLLLAVPMPTGGPRADPRPSAAEFRGRWRPDHHQAPADRVADPDHRGTDPEHQEWWARTRHQQVDWFDRVLGCSWSFEPRARWPSIPTKN